MKKFIAGFIGVFMLLTLTMSTVSALFSNSWTTSTSSIDAPTARYGHTAVWDNTNWNDMYVWGGTIFGARVNTGAIYDTSANAWYPTNEDGAPEARSGHTGVWASDCNSAVGDQSCMIVWGGRSFTPALNTGGKFDGMIGEWKPTSTISAPLPRIGHTGVWAGDCDPAVGDQPCMIVWGGLANAIASVSSGGKYFPATDTWVPTATVGAPQGRYDHTAVWTGTEMVVWGGINRQVVDDIFTPLNTGARYNPVTNTWVAIDSEFAPEPRGLHTAVWLDGWGLMIVWGGVDCSVVTSSGCDDKPIRTGGVYDVATNTWWSTSEIGAPSPRYGHVAVWASSFDTGVEDMLIWGGHNGSPTGGTLGDGAAYNPATDTWTTISSVNAPSPRLLHSAVWTGTEMIVWGGTNFTGILTPLGDGKRFTP